MNLYHLQYFTVLAKLEHYGKAAAQLNISQPSLSHAMAALEEELGVPLFEKTGRNIRLNQNGKLFYGSVEETLQSLEIGVRQMEDVKEGGGRLRVGCTRPLGIVLVPRLLHDFVQSPEGRQVEVQVHTGFSGGLSEQLLDGEFDIIFCAENENLDALEKYTLFIEPFYVVVNEQHPLAVKSAVFLEEALEYPFVGFAPGSSLLGTFRHLFEKMGLQPKTLMEIEEDQVIAGMVANGFGMAILPHLYVNWQLPLKELSILNEGWCREIYVAVCKEGYVSKAARRFFRYCTQREYENGKVKETRQM